MTVLIIIVIIVGAFILSKMNDTPSYHQNNHIRNSSSFSTTKSALEYKYGELIELINSGHLESTILERGANKIIVGVSNYAGSTTWHLSENKFTEDLDITYKLRNNPSFPDMTLHFSFTQDTCVNNPNKALLKINELIQAEIVKLIS